jgi:hypothetical protein
MWAFFQIRLPHPEDGSPRAVAKSEHTMVAPSLLESSDLEVFG